MWNRITSIFIIKWRTFQDCTKQQHMKASRWKRTTIADVQKELQAFFKIKQNVMWQVWVVSTLEIRTLYQQSPDSIELQIYKFSFLHHRRSKYNREESVSDLYQIMPCWASARIFCYEEEIIKYNLNY